AGAVYAAANDEQIVDHRAAHYSGSAPAGRKALAGACLLQLVQFQDLHLRFGVRFDLAVFRLLLLLHLQLLAADPLKRLLHVRIEARAVAEVGVENVFHAISCWGPERFLQTRGGDICAPALVSPDYRAAATSNEPVRIAATAVVVAATRRRVPRLFCAVGEWRRAAPRASPIHPPRSQSPACRWRCG